MTSPVKVNIGLWIEYLGFSTCILNVHQIHCMVVVGSENVGPVNHFNTLEGWCM